MKNLKNLTKRAKQAGFTLVEFMIVAALIIAGGVIVFNMRESANIGATVHAESTNIGTITARTKAVFTSRGSFTGLNDTLAVSAKIYPQAMVADPTVGAEVIRNGWGGTVGITATNDSGAAGVTHYTLSYAGVPQAQCIDLVSGLDSVFVSSRVNGVTTKAAGGALNTATLAGATACGAGDNNTLSLTAL